MPTPVGSSNNIAKDAHFTCDTKPRAVRNAKTTHPDGDFAQPDHTDDVAEPSPPPASLRTTSVVRALPTIPHGQARTALASKLRAVSVAAESTPEPAPVQVPSTSASKVKTRTAPASEPGAVSVAAVSVPEPVPVRVPDASSSNVKTRTAPASKPGAVSVAAEKTPEPAPVQVPSTSASKVKTRTAPASNPGAVSVAAESTPEPAPVQVPSTSASKVKTRTAPASKPGAVSVAAASVPPVRVPDASSSNVKTRTAPASKPGAVIVAAEKTPEPAPVQLPNASACNAKARTVPAFKPGAVNATAAKRPAVPSTSTSEITSSKTPTFKPGAVSITTASVPEPAPVQMPNVSASDFDTRTAPASKPRTVSVINADAAKSSNIVVATMEGSSIANKPSDRESAKGRALNPGASAATAKSHFATKGYLCSVPPSNDSLRATADFSAGKNIAKNTAVSGHAVEKNLAFREATIQRNTHSLSGQDALVVANASDAPVSEVQAVEPGHTKSVANQTMKNMQTKLEEMEVQHLNNRSAHEDGNSKNDKGESSPFSEAGLSAMHHSYNLRHLTELFPVETKGDRGIANSPDGMSGLAATGDENLAIAIAVEDVEEKGTLVAAFEYDPDAKPTIFKNRRFQMYTILGCLFAIGAIVTGIIVSTTNAGEDETVFVTLSPTITPTMAPTTLIFNELRNEFAKQIGPQALSSEESYESVAKWITEEDPLQVTPDDSNFLQRYILALFWFQTTNNGMDPWLSCNRPVGEEDETCMFLNFTTIDDNFEIAYKEESAVRWLSGTNECRWPGIFCHEGSVVSIRLAGCSLNGPIPVELQFLNVLNYLGLHYNLLTGVIPSEVAGLKNLIALELQGNLLEGQIPADLFTSDILLVMNLGDNLFAGTIPDSIGSMSSIQGLFMYGNDFQGQLPDSLGNLSNLQFTRWQRNRFSGSTLPTTIGKLTDLEELWMFSCDMGGKIPIEIGDMTEIQNIRMMNNLFTGLVPPGIGGLTKLTSLELQENRLSGPLPDEIYNLTALTAFALFRNKFTGTISPLIASMQQLQFLVIHTNQFTGPIPNEIALLRNLVTVWIYFNQFSGAVPLDLCELRGPSGLQFLNADCRPVGSPSNDCFCCTACCNRENGACFVT